MIGRRSRDRARLQRELILLPISANARHASSGDRFAVLIADQVHRDRADVSRAGPGIERTFVFRVRPHRHAPVTHIQHARFIAGAGLLHVEAKARFERVARAGLLVDIHLGGGAAVFEQIP